MFPHVNPKIHRLGHYINCGIQAGVWESDEELDEFLADLYASRRANVA